MNTVVCADGEHRSLTRPWRRVEAGDKLHDSER
jgi:hypothetical protein